MLRIDLAELYRLTEQRSDFHDRGVASQNNSTHHPLVSISTEDQRPVKPNAGQYAFLGGVYWIGWEDEEDVFVITCQFGTGAPFTRRVGPRQL